MTVNLKFDTWPEFFFCLTDHFEAWLNRVKTKRRPSKQASRVSQQFEVFSKVILKSLLWRSFFFSNPGKMVTMIQSQGLCFLGKKLNPDPVPVPKTRLWDPGIIVNMLKMTHTQPTQSLSILRQTHNCLSFCQVGWISFILEVDCKKLTC